MNLTEDEDEEEEEEEEEDEDEEKEEQFGQIEASCFGALSVLSAVVVGMSRWIISVDNSYILIKLRLMKKKKNNSAKLKLRASVP